MIKGLQALAFAQDVGEDASTIEFDVSALGGDKAPVGLRLNNVRVGALSARKK